MERIFPGKCYHPLRKMTLRFFLRACSQSGGIAAKIGVFQPNKPAL
jgi:hypothetical protein